MQDTDYSGEIWKEQSFPFEHINFIRVEVSNFGRVKTYSKFHPEGRIIQGSLVGGYPVVRLKFFKKRDEELTKKFQYLRKQITTLTASVNRMKKQLDALPQRNQEYYDLKEKYTESENLRLSMEKSYRKEYRADELKRTYNYGGLIHRMVALAFVVPESELHNLASHLDHNKKNNHISNLVWLTREQSAEHQKKSPNVIKEKEQRKLKERNENTKVYKLTSTKVMLIKKKINQGVTLRKLSKIFKVTETQLLRIKRGENWGHVPAAT
jgi:hypothetical protein